MSEQRLIDASKIVEVAEHAYHEWNLAMAAADSQREINRVYKIQELCKAVKAVADAAPTVDAVPVVRCKDCRRFSKSGYEEANQYEEDLSLHMGYCSEWRKGIQGCRFCSYGERRDDND